MADGDGERDEKKPRGAAANKNGSRRMEIEEWAPRLWLERRVRAANEEAREGKDVSSGYRREERHLLCDFAFCPGRLLKPIRREYEMGTSPQKLYKGCDLGAVAGDALRV